MVKAIIDDIVGFMADSIDKIIVCYGAGNNFDEVLDKYDSYGLADHITAIIDGNEKLHHTNKIYQHKEFNIISLEEFLSNYEPQKIILLITNYKYFSDIICELDKYQKLSEMHVYVGSFLDVKYDRPQLINIRESDEKNIPKIIHYCWFGGESIPQEYEEYMESWKIYFSDYEIIQWDESNYDVNKIKYSHEAYQEKKWAFVSDYARIDILNAYGGIYLDCDVEVLKPWGVLRGNSFFAGFEDHMHINLGLGFGAIKGYPYLEQLIELYSELSFRTVNGLNMTACPVYQSEIAKKRGFEMNNTMQIIDDMVLYPTNVFAPVSFWGIGQKDDSSYSIHHYKATWHTEEERQHFMERKQRGSILYQRYRQNETN